MHAMLPSISMRSANGLLLHLKEMPSKTQLSFHGKIRIARLMANEPQTHDSTVEDEPTVRPHSTFPVFKPTGKKDSCLLDRRHGQPSKNSIPQSAPKSPSTRSRSHLCSSASPRSRIHKLHLNRAATCQHVKCLHRLALR